jgi:predicted aspartyl protease
MMLFRYAALLALLLVPIRAVAAPPAGPADPVIPPSRLDNSLEITGDALAAQQRRTRLLVDVRINDRGPYRFLVDSGADRSVIGAALARDLALPAGDKVMLQAMAGRQQVDTVIIDRLLLGRSEIAGISAPALPENFLGAQGLIGIDALADQRLLLDFDASTITVQDSRRPVVAMDGEIVVTARRRKGQLIITEASANGTPVLAVIDSGSEVTIGNLALRDKIFRGRRPPEMQQIALMSVTGETLLASMATLTEVKVGGIILGNVRIAFVEAAPFKLFGIDRQPAMMMGTDLLRSFRRVSLDFRNRRVRFVLRR